MPSSLSTPRPVEPTTTLAPVPLPELLATIQDHRHRRGIRHRLDILLTVSLAAVAAGAKSYTDIADWVNDPVNTAIADLGVDLHRRPSEPTIRRALSSVDADVLDRIIGAWTWTRTATFNGRRVIAVDGKTVRGARTPSDPDSRAPHLVAAYDHCHGAVVGQVGVDAKTNEIPAARELLSLLDLTDVLVSLDALHTQVDTARHIVAAGGDYLMTVKKNQKSLYSWATSLAWHKVPTNSDQSPRTRGVGGPSGAGTAGD